MRPHYLALAVASIALAAPVSAMTITPFSSQASATLRTNLSHVPYSGPILEIRPVFAEINSQSDLRSFVQADAGNGLVRARTNTKDLPSSRFSGVTGVPDADISVNASFITEVVYNGPDLLLPAGALTMSFDAIVSRDFPEFPGIILQPGQQRRRSGSITGRF